MKTLVCLGAALFVAALSLSAADVPALISQPPAKSPGGTSKRAPRPLPERPGETAEQRTVRHNTELQEAAAKANEQAKEFPGLTAPGWQAKQALFLAEVAKLKSNPQFQRRLLPSVKPGQPLPAKTSAQIQAERLDADQALMRKQADKVLEQHPELRDYVEQWFQWHQRMFTLAGKYADNPKVQQLVVNRLSQPLPPTP